jgi:ABC-type uncharacterized transport system substrate-binding protein
MKRRDVIKFLGGVAAGWPLLPIGAEAQEPGRTYRLGGLFSSPRDAPHYVAMFEELRRSGFIEGQNLTVNYWLPYGLRIELLSEFATDPEKTQVDVILAGGDAGIRAAQQATATIPILALTDDMVGSGLVSSLGKPGANTTGVSLLAADLDGKRQEILMEAVPGLHRMATLADTSTTAPHQIQALQDAARARGVELSIHRVANPDEIAPAIDAAKASDAAAINVLASPLLFGNRQLIIEHTTAVRLPAMYQWPEVAEEGGFVGYGPRIVQLYREVVARQLIKILRGAKPADMPVEQPTKFELAINLKAAKAIGLTIPESFLARADEMIE